MEEITLKSVLTAISTKAWGASLDPKGTSGVCTLRRHFRSANFGAPDPLLG